MSSTRWMTLVSVLLLCPASALAQPRSDAATPLTPWGDPDLQGMWPSGSLVWVPFERPEALGTRAVFTDEERAERAQDLETFLETATTTGTGPGPAIWGHDVQPPPLKASMVVDLENGRLPPMTDDGPVEHRSGRQRLQRATPTPVPKTSDHTTDVSLGVSSGLHFPTSTRPSRRSFKRRGS